MGRQIEFIHIEEDIVPFLAAIERCGGYIVNNGDVKLAPAYSEKIITQMSIYNRLNFLKQRVIMSVVLKV